MVSFFYYFQLFYGQKTTFSPYYNNYNSFIFNCQTIFIIFLVIGCFLVAFAFNVFFAPNNIVTGGVSGVSIVVKNIFGISTSTFIAITYIALLILSYIFLGKRMTRNSLIGSILYPIFLIEVILQSAPITRLWKMLCLPVI